MSGPYVVTVEDQMGGFLAVGPFDDEEAAQARADEYQATLRIDAWRADDCNGHPDDPPVFAWVVPLVPPDAPIERRYADGDGPLTVYSSTDFDEEQVQAMRDG